MKTAILMQILSAIVASTKVSAELGVRCQVMQQIGPFDARRTISAVGFLPSFVLEIMFPEIFDLLLLYTWKVG